MVHDLAGISLLLLASKKEGRRNKKGSQIMTPLVVVGVAEPRSILLNYITTG